MNHRETTAVGSMTLRYVLVLLALAALSLVNYYLLQEQIRTNHASGIMANIGGRQRFLLQRTAVWAARLVETTDEAEQEALRRELLSSAQLMELSHRGLVEGNESIGLPGANTREIRAIYFEGDESLDESILRYIAEVRALAESPAEELTVENPHWQHIQQAANEGQLWSALDRAVAHYQQESESQLNQLRYLQRLALGSTLMLLLLTALVVFWPMQRRIQEEMQKLTALNETLEQRVAERSAAAEERAAALAASESALKERTRILRSILDSMSDGVVVVDRQGKFLLFNPAAEQILGIGPQDASPQQWSEHFGLYLADCVTAYPTEELPLVKAMQGESVDRVEIFVRPASGPAGIWLSCSARPLVDDQGEIRGGVAVFQNFTRRKQAEAALRESEALYQSLLDALPLYFIRKDLDSAFTFANQRFCEMIHRPLDDLLGKTDFDLFPVELAEKYLGDDHRVIDTQQTFEDVEEHRKPDGELMYVQVLKAPVYDAQRNVVGTQGIFWDVTDRQRAQVELRRTAAELARSNEELQQFALVASHDLQEPLRKVQAFGDQLQARYADVLDERGRDYLARMQDAAARMQQLINDLLSLSRVTTQGRPFLPVDLAQIAREVVADLQTRLERTEGSVEIGELPTIDADPLQMRQLLQNLIGNGLKFHRPGTPPVVRVFAEPVEAVAADACSAVDATRCRLIVEDNGIGFEEKYLDRIFTVFQRLHGRGEYEGTGVGLAICRKIVERHGGTITARSTVGQGSVFVVTLPMKTRPETTAHEEARTAYHHSDGR